MRSSKKKVFASIVLVIVAGLGFWILNDRNSPENKLKRYVEKMDATCPIAYDNFTRVDSIKLKGSKKVSFYCTYISEKEISNIHAAKRFINYKRSTDVIVNPSLKFFRERYLVIEFAYFDKNKKSITNLFVEPKDYVTVLQ